MSTSIRQPSKKPVLGIVLSHTSLSSFFPIVLSIVPKLRRDLLVNCHDEIGGMRKENQEDELTESSPFFLDQITTQQNSTSDDDQITQHLLQPHSSAIPSQCLDQSRER